MPEAFKKRADIIVELPLGRGVTLETVEFCAAGSFAHLLSQEGASEALHGGFVV